MKKNSKIVFFAFFMLCSSISNAQSQYEMNLLANTNYVKADKELNKIYKKLLTLLNPKEKVLLVKAQNEWLKFRNSDCAFVQEGFDGGSIQPMIYYDCLKERTLSRVKDLKNLVEFYTDK